VINLNRWEFIIYSSATLGTSLVLKACTNNPNANPTSMQILHLHPQQLRG
jgi:hypothetical protein